jgi:hypothetical protein
MDALAIALLIGGLALYAVSYWNMKQVIAGRVRPDPGKSLALKVDAYRRIGNVGFVLAGAGVIVAVVAGMSHRRRQDLDAS